MRRARWLAWLGWLLALAVAVSLAWVFPEGGGAPNSLRQGLGLGLVFAAAPTAIWIRPGSVTSIVIGGGWLVAGAATLIGGNGIMLVAIVYGLALVIVGAVSEPVLTPRLVGRLVSVAVLLIMAVVLALGTTVVAEIAALTLSALAVLVAVVPGSDLSRPEDSEAGDSRPRLSG